MYHIDLADLGIYADPLFEKVIYTLLEDTIRHGKRATNVWFHTIFREQILLLVYEDNGIGVEETEKLRIFEKSYGKSTGFGIFLAQEILAMTGMTITERGIFGSGVRFEIRIPRGAWKISEKNSVHIISG